MDGPAPSWAELERLVESGALDERAFAAGELHLRFARTAERPRVLALRDALRRRALGAHANLRAEIRSGALRGERLRQTIEREAPHQRDHFVEELLDIAYPTPVEAPSLPRELVSYSPSGWTEIVHALDRTSPTSLVDLGSGLGKVVLLASLLTGARARGIELDAELSRHAQEAAASLDVTGASFVTGDARDADLDTGDVFYLYVPFTGTVLDVVMRRLALIAHRRRIMVCSQALDVRRYPWLRSANAPSFWLDVYESL